MICYCCQRDVSLVRRVLLRGDPGECPPGGFASPADPAYQAYLHNNAFRTAFICPGCYHSLDNEFGVGEIGGRAFNLAGKSRGGRVPVYSRHEADKLGMMDDEATGPQLPLGP